MSEAIEPVYIDLGDGRQREVRATIRSIKTLRTILGPSFLGRDATDENEDSRKEAQSNLIVDNLPVIVHAMLIDRSGVTVDSLDDLPASMIEPLTTAVTTAVQRAFPNEPAANPTAEAAAS